ncbi:Low temperature viability protein [Hesseltinella vesiculosa]|uniref:Low temperature viability protein n=1 Tax=Hesseltinella vesiculosa TaxID=101127 RepID=A0A1X2GAC4_9FUNG|nr:Low temperature viability protein [Hesseltinella vesiculosa]
MPKKTFIDRKTAKHFNVVHRSQRDPLINDTDASSRVLQEVVPSNLIKHKSAAEMQRLGAKPKKLTQDEIDSRVGQAALHGIYFDDGEYDYMQHLKPMGSNTDAVFLEAPLATNQKKDKQKSGGLQFRDEDTSTADLFNKVERQKNPNLVELPMDVLPSGVEVSGANQSTGLDGGLQPDMDPRLREVLEALEDEEYVEDDLAESFFDDLNDLEAEEYDPYEDEYDSDDYYDSQGEEEEEVEEYFEDGSVDPENYDWQTAFNKFKRDQRRSADSDDEFDDDRDDIRSKGTGFSVSSSAMVRNSQLQILDDRFEKIEEMYMKDDDEEEEEEEGQTLEERADFDAILDEFLEKYEVVGRKMAPRLEGDTSVAKLDTIRHALDTLAISEAYNDDETKPTRKHDPELNKLIMPVEPKHHQTWDCQSIISTYSNLENHPQLIKDNARQKKITIDPKTGMPVLVEKQRKQRVEDDHDADRDDANEDLSSEGEEDPENLGVKRSKLETKEEKKLRKQAVKDAKKNRRTEKKSTKEAFKSEENKQLRSMKQQRMARAVTHIN